jgi:AbrB family looped-hinge helix DNA binding protein
MLVRLSSKGQLVIPGAVRRALRLSPGTELNLEVIDKKIVLAPVVDAASPIDALYGRFAGHDLLGDLEQEHREEIERERAVRP